jgi:hypothetical protein
VQKFDYRYPRYRVDLPVEFTVDETTVMGRCTEISEEGMRLEVGEPLVSGACGTVSFSLEGKTLKLNVRVAHVESNHGGLVFLHGLPGERNTVAQFVALLAASRSKPGPVLLKKT